MVDLFYLIGPSEDWKWENTRREPSVQNILVWRQTKANSIYLYQHVVIQIAFMFIHE